MHIGELQQIIKQRDYKPELAKDYFLKLVEEVGELSEVILKGTTYENGHSDTIKGTIYEELYDVIFYCLALANVYGIDMEQAVSLKETINQARTDH
jgi:NTP pyrophosphatase (non-canonical NTP hydrolase)